MASQALPNDSSQAKLPLSYPPRDVLVESNANGNDTLAWPTHHYGKWETRARLGFALLLPTFFGETLDKQIWQS